MKFKDLLAKHSGIEPRRYGEVVTLETRAEANETINREKRYQQILEVLDGRQMTAKEIAVELFKMGKIKDTDRNNTAPRLTELSHKGKVDIIGKKICKYSGKRVAVYEVRV